MPHYALAIGFLTLALLTPLAVAAVLLLRRRRSRFTVVQSLLFCLALFYVRVVWRTRRPQPLPLPPEQGAIFISNHRSSVDPFFIQVCADRPIHWMVAREYCEHPAFRLFLRSCAVIPVNRRGIDTMATREAIRLARSGGYVGMLPEGRINMSSEFMLPVRPGAVWVALKARVPIVPAYIHDPPFDGSPWGALLMTAKAGVYLGQPIDLSPYFDRDPDEATLGSLILEATGRIAELAGRPDFRPQVAGRQWRPSDQEQRALVEGVRRKLRGGRE